MTDEEILQRLAAAFAPEPVDPPTASIYALRRAVRASRTPARRWPRRRWAVSALAGFTLMGTSGAAFAATGAVLPQPIRQVVHGVGLPVDSPELARARAERGTLRRGLGRGDRAEVARQAAGLRDAMQELNSEERDRIEPEADDLLMQADAFLNPPRQPGSQEDTGQQGSESGTDEHAPGSAGPGSDQREAPGTTEPGTTTDQPGGAPAPQGAPAPDPGNSQTTDQSAG